MCGSGWRLTPTMMSALVLLAVVGTAEAGVLKDGEAAYERGDYATALRLFRTLADLGDAFAQDDLGVMYDNGQGVQQDYAEALKWYRLAANQGDAGGEANLGLVYATGHGVRQDYAEAVKWLRLAAEQGDAAAQYNLATMYGNGRGVPQDYVQAHMWFSLAASSEKDIRDEAVKCRDFSASKMTPAQIAEARKLTHEWKPKYVACAASPTAWRSRLPCAPPRRSSAAR
jgi:uncharacterized protein